jgi:hypothetical protein
MLGALLAVLGRMLALPPSFLVGLVLGFSVALSSVLILTGWLGLELVRAGLVTVRWASG